MLSEFRHLGGLHAKIKCVFSIFAINVDRFDIF